METTTNARLASFSYQPVLMTPVISPYKPTPAPSTFYSEPVRSSTPSHLAQELMILGGIKTASGLLSAIGNRYLFKTGFLPAFGAEIISNCFETTTTGILLHKNSTLEGKKNGISWGSAISSGLSTVLIAVYSALKQRETRPSRSKIILPFLASLAMNLGIGYAEGWLTKIVEKRKNTLAD